MSTVKSNKFSPQSLPIVQIDGFNEVESFVVGAGQTSFDSTKFTNTTPIRAFKRNDIDPSVWDELTVTWSDVDTFTVAESYSEGEEIIMFGIGNYYKGDENLSSDNVVNDSTNTEFTASLTLTDIVNLLGASSKLESYKDYGIGSTDLTQVDLITSETIESGLYTLLDVGYSGNLIQFEDSGNIKQIYIPFGKDQIQTRDNSSGSFPDFKPASAIDIGSETTSFTLAEDDAYKHIRVSNAGAVSVTIPDSATLNFPIGTNISIIQAGAGQITITSGAGVIINSADSLVSTRVQYSTISLIKVGTDEWDLAGDIA